MAKDLMIFVDDQYHPLEMLFNGIALELELEVSFFSAPEGALEFIKQNQARIAVVIMDGNFLKGSNMTGLQAVEKIREFDTEMLGHKLSFPNCNNEK